MVIIRQFWQNKYFAPPNPPLKMGNFHNFALLSIQQITKKPQLITI
jgi:hypothetical protein